MKLRLAAVAVAAAALTACSSGVGGGRGEATVWVTRDRGAHIVLVRKIPAGLTAMQGLMRVADVKTRYAGRFVQAIDGIEGSLTRRRDWFYFVNGIEADRGAAEYRLHPGDIEWWDYRSWRGEPELRVVPGAFPEPLLHGYDGNVLPTVVRYERRDARLARRLAALVHARSVELIGTRVPARTNEVRLGRGESLDVSIAGNPHGRVVYEIGAATARAVLRNPSAYRFRFSVP